MSDLSYEYIKKRREFGLPFQLSDTPSQLLHSLDPSKKEAATWRERFATTIDLDCIPEVADVKVRASLVVGVVL